VPTIVMVSHQPAGEQQSIVWSERVAAEFLDSPHYGSQLLERMRWALEDAENAERERRAA
jgi:hypothetical protein